MIAPTQSRYRWYILLLSALTSALTVAIPSMCLSVLFEEISRDLGLDVIQIGMVWGIGALPGIVTVLLGGVISDQFGPRRILIIMCILVGAAGALRGIAQDFAGLMALAFVFGFISPVVQTNILKTCGLWFPGKQVGRATGIISMAMALGFMISALVSAAVLSPLLGGWRAVLYLYGGLAMLLAIPWYFTRQFPTVKTNTGVKNARTSIWKNLAYIARMRQIWLLGWALLGFNSCVQGALGYLPLYLRGQGWEAQSADGASSLFHLVSLVFVIPISFNAVRLGSRRTILAALMIVMAAGVGGLSFVSGPLIFAALVLAGMVRDGFMAVFLATAVDLDGIGAEYAGTVTGFVLACASIGTLLAPPVGNSLAVITPGLPFIFWSGLAIVGLFGLQALKPRRVVQLA